MPPANILPAREKVHTAGPIYVRKCPCGDPICNQYTLSTQGGVGFLLEEATLYAAAPELLEACQEAEQAIITMLSAIAGGNADAGQRFADKDPTVINLRAAIAKAVQS